MNSLFYFIIGVFNKKENKMKNIILITLITLFFSGCNINTYNNREEIVVSKILKSQQTIYDAGQSYPSTLLSSNILYADNYYHDSSTVDDILSLALDISDITFIGLGYNRFNLSNVSLDFDLDMLTQDYVYDYSGYLYDDYQRYHFSTSTPFVGTQNRTPYKGIMQIIADDETMVVTIVNDVNVDIAVYDHYDSYYDHVIHTTWRALGF